MPSGRLLVLLLLSLVFAACAVASTQIPGLTQPPAPSSQQATIPTDPLGRENPRDCILGFIKAAQEENYALAVNYFQAVAGRRRASPEDEEELASQFITILNRKLAVPLDFVSRNPEGRLDDGLPPDQEKISGILGVSEPLPILLVRIEDQQRRKLWYISRKTLEQVPEVYDSLQFPAIEKLIPRTLVTHRFLAMPFWQWLAILLFISIALMAARILTRIVELITTYWRKSRGLPPLSREPLLRLGPATLTLTILIHYWFVNYIGTSLLHRLYYRRLIGVFLAFAFYWIFTRISRAISTRIGKSLSSRGMYAQRSIVSLVRRFVEVTLFIFVSILVLHSLGFDVTTALAGIGIGGLALGLGAQKTFENMFGGVSILFDKVIVIGDICKINNQTGVVEDIGLRSTRLRTPERTLLSIPNGIMASAVVENLRFRDKFLCQQVLRLRYDLAPDHIRYVLDQLRLVLELNAKVEKTTARVRFLRFAEYALEIEVYCYILHREYADYLAAQEDLLLQVMEILEKTGAVVALPSQTTFVSKDSWLDPEKVKAVHAAIEKVRDPGVPGPQSLPPSS